MKINITATEGDDAIELFDEEVDLIIGFVGTKDGELKTIWRNEGEAGFANDQVMYATLNMGGLIAETIRTGKSPNEFDLES